jgi:hypothetical protein
VPPEDGVTEAMPVNHGTASAVSHEADGSHEDEHGGADGSQKVDVHVVNSEMSAADTMSELESDTGRRRADRSYEDKPKRGDGSHEDEKKLRADSSAYVPAWYGLVGIRVHNQECSPFHSSSVVYKCTCTVCTSFTVHLSRENINDDILSHQFFVLGPSKMKEEGRKTICLQWQTITSRFP